MLIGYARVSTEDQRLDLQRDALIKAGVEPENIYEEHVSGAKSKRPELENALKALRPNDTLVVWRLDRLGRSLAELIKLLDRVKMKDSNFKSISESIETETAVGRMLFHILAAVAQFERDLVSERTRAGLKAARARGRRGGRKPKMGPKQIELALKLLADPLLTHPEVAQMLQVSDATLYRSISRFKSENNIAELDEYLRQKDKGKIITR